MVMVMVMVKIDEQGRIIIPKELREKKKLIGDFTIGVLRIPGRAHSGRNLLNTGIRIDSGQLPTIR